MLATFHGILGAVFDAWGTRAKRRLWPLAALCAVGWVTACAAPGTETGESGPPPLPKPVAAAAQGAAAARVSPAFDIGNVIRQVHFAYRPDGEGWSGGHDTYEVHATPDLFRVTPVRARDAVPATAADPRQRSIRGVPRVGKEAAQGAPAIFETTSIGRSTAHIPLPATPAAVAQDGHLAIARGEAMEHLRNGEEGVEQSFSFERPPAGSGDLVVRVRVSGQAYWGETEHGLHFMDPVTGLGVRYGRATWIDAEGVRSPLIAHYDAGEIVLIVPEEVVAGSAYPAILDPTISAEFGMDQPIPSFAAKAQELPNIAFDGQNYMVVWWDSRDISQSDSGYRIYGARVTPTGTLLDPGGIIVATGLDNMIYRRAGIGFNGTDYLVVWAAPLGNGDHDLRATTVSPAGAVGNPAGTIVHAGHLAYNWPTVASDGTSFLVVWHGGSTGGGIYGRRMNGSAPAGNVFTISQALNNQDSPSVAYDGTNYLVVWQDNRNGFNYDIYGARVTSAGTVLDAMGFVISAPAADQTSPSVAFDGANYLVAWSDSRWGTPDIYASRVATDGTVFDAAGIGVSSMVVSVQGAPSVAFDGTSYRLVWADSRSGNSDIYGARIDVGGAVLDGTGIPLSQAAATEHRTGIACGAGTCLAVWQDQRPDGTSEIIGTRVDANGAALDPSGVTVSAAANEQLAPSVVFNGTSYLAVWQDKRGGVDWDIYGARVSAMGTILDPSGIAVSTANGDQLTPRVAWDGSGYLAVWEDRRSDSGGDIYGARVGSDGVVADPGGITVDASSAQSQPALVWNGTNYFVVWRGNGIRGARVTSTGVVQDSPSFLVGTASDNYSEPEVAFDGTVQLVLWNAYPGSNLRGGRVTPAGALLDSTSGFAIASSVTGYRPAVAFDGFNFLVVYSYSSNILGRRVGANGSVLDPNGFAISTAAGTQAEPAVVFDGTDCVVAWRDYGASASASLSASWVTELGVVSPLNGLLVSSNINGDHGRPALASDLAGHTLVTYSRPDTAQPYGANRVRARLLSAVGTGNACTLPTDCVSGFCADGICCNTACGGGSSTDCLACSVAAGASVNGICGTTTGTSCSDGNACTQVDTCQTGTCVGGTSVSCPAPNSCHLDGTCNPATGQCTDALKPNGSTCDDGNACTQTDACQAGACAGASPVVCMPLDSCHLAGACNPADGQCTSPEKADGAACDDTDQCTQSETCQSGVCTLGNPVVCPPADDCHEAGSCSVATGTCIYPEKANGSACDDGNLCTQIDTCQAGVCAGSGDVACPPPDGCHNPGMCNPVTGACLFTPKTDGAACDDGNKCTTADTCQTGVCVSGSNKPCPGPKPCQLDNTCNPATGACEVTTTLDGSACNDTNECTQVDTCVSGVCQGKDPVTCPGDECHADGSCKASSGVCQNEELPDGTPCSNGTCQSGTCAPVEGTGGGGAGGGSTGGGSTGGAPTGEAGGSGGAGSGGAGPGGPGGTSGSDGGSDGGCGCRTSAKNGGERAWLTLVTLALAAGVTRRRRGRQNT